MLTYLTPAFTKGFISIAILTVCSFTLQAEAPKGWFVAGSMPADYESGIDELAAFNGNPSAYLRAKQSAVRGFGTLMQGFRADHYLGTRVRFRAFVKTERAQGWVGLWMRVDGSGKPVAFDNMYHRPIRGTTDWRQYDIVLDVPQDATSISLGVLLDGSGEVWLNGTKFEAVPAVPTTGTGNPQTPNTYLEGPINRDFTDYIESLTPIRPSPIGTAPHR